MSLQQLEIVRGMILRVTSPELARAAEPARGFAERTR